MSRKHRSLTSVLARSSTTEGLKLRSDVVQELTFLISAAIRVEHVGFSVVIDKARGFPSRSSSEAQYLRTVHAGEKAYRPSQEVVRQVLLWGRFGPLEDDGAIPFESDEDEKKIVARRTCEFLADCEVYCQLSHSRLGARKAQALL